MLAIATLLAVSAGAPSTHWNRPIALPYAITVAQVQRRRVLGRSGSSLLLSPSPRLVARCSMATSALVPAPTAQPTRCTVAMVRSAKERALDLAPPHPAQRPHPRPSLPWSGTRRTRSMPPTGSSGRLQGSRFRRLSFGCPTTDSSARASTCGGRTSATR